MRVVTNDSIFGLLVTPYLSFNIFYVITIDILVSLVLIQFELAQARSRLRLLC